MPRIDVLVASALTASLLLMPLGFKAQGDSSRVEEESNSVSGLMPAWLSCKELLGEERHFCTQSAIIQYVSSHVVYPRRAKNWGIQGTVFVYFVVGEDGNVRDVKVLRGVHRHLDLEAVRVVQSMPKFVPGFLEGEFVPVEYTIPVKFIIRRPAGNRRP